jgi:hypothetical protein
MQGEILTANDHVWYSFEAQSQQTFAIEVMLGTLSDSVLDVVDVDRRTVLAENDDDERDGVTGYASYLDWTAPATGTYYIMVKAYSTEVGSFTLMVTAQSMMSDPCGPLGASLSEPRAQISFTPDGGTADNQDCSWTITCPTGVVNLDFDSFETERDYDFVNIFDGPKGTAQLDSVSGNMIDMATTHYASTRSVLTIEFASDESVGAGGFAVTYECGAPPPPPPRPPPPPPPPPPVVGPPPPPDVIIDTGHMDRTMIQADGTAAHGQVQQAGDQEWFDFHATAGTTYQMEVQLGTLDDSIIDLIDNDQATVIAENDDDERGGGGYASYMEWTCPADGDYFVVVKGYGDSTGSFDVAVTTAGGGGGGDSAVVDPCVGTGDVMTSPAETIIFQPEGDYADNIQCTWSIQCPGNGSPSLTINAFESEADYDFLNIYDGPAAQGDPVQSLSGSLAAGEIAATTTTATRNSLTIQFVSDESIGAGGFVVAYQCAALAPPPPPPPPAPPPPPPHGMADDDNHIITSDGTMVDGTITEDSHDWYSFTGLAGETYEIEVVLDGTLDDSVLDLVNTDRATVIVENDDDERTDGYASYIIWTCPADGTYFAMVKGYDSYTTGTYHIAITRQTANDNTGTITGSACDGEGMSFNVASSTISFQPDGNYDDNSNCYWHITCPANGSPTVDFTEFDTESDWDFVRVYNDATGDGPVAGELTGALVDLPATHFTNNGPMTIQFESDESVTAGGFQARFTCA